MNEREALRMYGGEVTEVDHGGVRVAGTGLGTMTVGELDTGPPPGKVGIGVVG